MVSSTGLSRRHIGGSIRVTAPLTSIRVGSVLRNYFVMGLEADEGYQPNHEVVERRWVTLHKAKKLLDRDADREVLKRLKQKLVGAGKD